MPRRHLVATLPQNEIDFIIDAYIKKGCKTSRALSEAYEKEFKKKLPKSSVHRWLKDIGESLIEQYDLQHQIGNQIAARLSQEPNADKFKVVIENIKDGLLLNGLHDVIQSNPAKFIQIQQEEKKREQKEREIELKRDALQLERERVHGVALDRVKLGEEFSEDLLEYIGNDAEGLTWFRKHAKPFVEFIQQKYADAKA